MNNDKFEQGKQAVENAAYFVAGAASVPARAAKAIGQGCINLVFNLITFAGCGAIIVYSFWALATGQPWTKRVADWGGIICAAVLSFLFAAFVRARITQRKMENVNCYDALIWGSLATPRWIQRNWISGNGRYEQGGCSSVPLTPEEELMTAYGNNQ